MNTESYRRSSDRSRLSISHALARVVLALMCTALAAMASSAGHAATARLRKDDTDDPDSVGIVFGPTTGLAIEAGQSKFEFHVLTWLRAQSDSRIGGETDAEATIPVARLIWQGHLFDPRLHFFVQPEFSGTRAGELLDLFVEWHFDESLVVRAGQFRTPYSRAFITPLSNLELAERGLVVDEFRIGRDTGAMASGDLADKRVHYDLGVFNGAEINDLADDRDAPEVVARTELRFGTPVPYDQAPSLVLDDPHGVTLGFGGAWSRRGTESTTGTATAETLWNATTDVAWMQGPLSVHAEGFWRGAKGSPRPANAFGAFVQTGVFVVPRLLEVGARAGWISNGPDVESYEAFLAGYWNTEARSLGHHLKTILEYRHDSGDRSGVDLRDRHLATLQAQIFF